MATGDDVPTKKPGIPDWSRIGQVFAGSVLLAIAEYYIQLAGLVGGTLEAIGTGLLEYIAALVSGIFGVSIGTLAASWDSASEFIVSLGPFAFLGGVVITFGTLFLLVRAGEAAV